jgi:large subunit ribosomal protein L22e
MVAVRAKVGARSFIRTRALSKGKKNFKIDCSIPAADGIFSPELLQGFEQYFQENTKLHGRKGKLADKVKVALADNILSISTTMAYRKRYFKYLTKKFLKKKNLRDWIRILAKGKDTYTLKYFNIQDQEEASE